jgi:nucleotide-binding universal stress UspA family protein
MNLPKHILVPTDFSEGAEAALDYAVALAGKLDARVTLLHVVAVPLLGAEMGMVLTEAMIDDAIRGNQAELDRLATARAEKCAFGPNLLEMGDPRAQIEHVADKVSADLIVMGTHGRRGFKRLVMGSVAEAIARVAPCPVLLIRQPAM